jgi:hypothetical protein
VFIVLNVHSNESAKSESVVYFSWQSPLCFDILVSMGVAPSRYIKQLAVVHLVVIINLFAPFPFMLDWDLLESCYHQFVQ